jgi:4-amino-4-deoxy-L-arabinose transferase-like glycosyltransferase
MTRKQIVAYLGLGLVITLAAFLRFYRLGAYGVGNAYYAATVQSMLTSWHNFFFPPCEPGGSVTVDKPPLGFWVQAASAYVFGINGFALALPQALAGVLSVLLVYMIVERQLGTLAGLTAAAALAVMPVAVAVERNNAVDGLLVFVLLLATWALLRAVRSGRLRDLFLSMTLMGVGFNIKMMQAFMPLPALYVLYFLGVRHRWRKRIVYLAAATVVLIGVSLSWAIAVDLTPADERPYIGGSRNNTVMELAIGYNALTRLGLDLGQGPGAPAPPPQRPPPPPALLYQDVGLPGWQRLFTPPLIGEASWVLPFVLLGIPLILVQLGWRWPLGDRHLALVLWGGWLLPELIYFTFNRGLFHPHYLIMLGAPLAALVGVTAWALEQVYQKRRWLGCTLSALLVGSTVAFQVITLRNHLGYTRWVFPIFRELVLHGQRTVASFFLHVWWAAAIPIALLALGLSISALTARRAQPWLSKTAFSISMMAVLVTPLFWSGLTTFNDDPDACLPRSGLHIHHTHCPSTLPVVQQQTLEYLLANTEPGSYLVATLASHEAALYILATGRPVLPLGGFTGDDDVVDVAKLAQMVQEGRLRFILGDRELAWKKPEIAAWLEAHCRRQANGLYDCGSP